MRLQNNCPRLYCLVPTAHFQDSETESAAGELAPLIFLNPLAFTLNAAVNVGLPQEARVSSFKDSLNLKCGGKTTNTCHWRRRKLKKHNSPSVKRSHGSPKEFT